jgi:predicted polyphosphate/ATP-dependent NAD kinase
MGGRVGLKGTDGIAAEAARLGAKPRANAQAQEALDELRRLLQAGGTPLRLEWLTASGIMGYEALRAAGFDAQTVHLAAPRHSGQDTEATAERFLASGVDIVLFCGGDGTESHSPHWPDNTS